MIIELLTAVLVVITAFYAWATYKILRANEKVVEAMYEQAIAVGRPYVVVAPTLEVDNPIFYLRVSNTGKTAAEKLQLTIDKPFFKFGEKGESKNLASFAAFNQPIDSFSPGAEITFSLAQGFKVFEGSTENPDMPHTFSITAKYEFAGRQVQEVNRIDLRPYLGADVPQDAYIRKLREMSESLKKMAASASKAP
ncbi:MAG: hypothetical protein V4454_05750 [Pseudomonadota bacterium]